jgi:hypothetical protein
MTKHSHPQHEASVTDEIIELVFHLVTAWRVELCLLAVPVGLGAWAYYKLGATGSIAVIVLVVLAAVLPPPARRQLGRTLHRARFRRHLDVAFAHLPGILSDRPPTVGKVVRTQFGDRVVLGLAHGTSVDDVLRAQAAIAASLHVREVRAVADSSVKNKVTLSILRRDPFGSAALSSPMLHAERTSAWDPTPVGIDEDGTIVGISLPENNLLIGGLGQF